MHQVLIKISGMDVSNVTDMYKMFLNAQSFDQDLQLNVQCYKYGGNV